MILWGIIAVAIATGVGILIFLAVRAIFEFFEEHSVARFILIGLVVVSLASELGPIVLVVVGGILLVKPLFSILAGIADFIDSLFPSHSYSDPMAVAPKVRKEDDEIIDFDTYEENNEIIDSDIYKDRYGNKYKYDRRSGELIDIDRNYNRIKVSQNGIYDSELEDSKGYSYDCIN